MARIYISSTYQDLVQHRDAVTKVLRQMQHEVVGMEDYASSDERPLDRCLRDVQSCEVYVGIFAWRYGFIPAEGGGKSVTELEYRAAEKSGVPRLPFLLKDDAPWPPQFMDAVGSAVRDSAIGKLREELWAARIGRTFVTPDDLAASVAAAVSLQVATAGQQQRAKLFVHLAHASRVELSASMVPDLSAGIEQARFATVLEIDFGATAWWSTRVLVVSLLARDYTTIAGIVFLDRERFVGVADVRTLCNVLTQRHPEIAASYAEARRNMAQNLREVLAQTIVGLQQDAQDERALKQGVDEPWLQGVLGPELTTDQVTAPQGPARPADLLAIVAKNARFVAAVRDGRLDRVIDRTALASQVATTMLLQKLTADG
jgi:hypothetical protein